ncbi:MAG: mannitol-1-phosphate 5-dehydrogenase [Spirochaetales bacterium]|nr:MAG: mannitol-1-phosphate 5-dehydrogenase [Spirochaetales bacterium]
MIKKLIQFGAGNIGRSFIGQVFSRSGFEVVFIDIADTIVDELNRRGEYRVIVKRNDKPDETITVKNVRAVNGKNREEAAAEVAGAAYVSTSVGKQALNHIMPVLAKGLILRRQETPSLPLDIIIAENLRNGAAFFREELLKNLPPDYPLDDLAGLVETSIGKMVPIMREEDIRQDPLWVFGEEYNSLIMDRLGFRNPVPEIIGAHPVDNIKAYVDRKLFIHNLGHAASAYFGFRHDPSWTYIWEPLQEPAILRQVREAMTQSALALQREYPADLPMPELEEHIDDLLFRFQNRALGDTIFRVGRDLMRKLEKSDRIVGAMLLAMKHGLPCDALIGVLKAALDFRAGDEQGRMFPGDLAFAEIWHPRGLKEILTGVSGLDLSVPLEADLLNSITGQK